MQLRPIFTGATGSPFTATILSLFVATMMPQPVPQNLHTDLSHFHPASVCFAAASISLGTLIPAAVAAATAAAVLRNSLLESDMATPPLSFQPFIRPRHSLYLHIDTE